MLDLFIKGGKIIENDYIFKGSIAVKSGKIVGITNTDIKVDAANVIDASGKMIFPGAIDCHAHLNDPGFEWREDFIHGSEAAAAGGVTTIIDMPLQNEPALTSSKIFLDKQNKIMHKSVVDYAFWGGLVDNNVQNIEELYKSGAIGLKAFLGPVSSDYSTINMGIARQALEITTPLGMVIGFHCEDYSIIKSYETKLKKENKFGRSDYFQSRPVIAELLAVKNVIEMARESGGKVHICHVSHPEVAKEIKKAKSEGVNITSETCPHYLVFTDNDMVENGAIFKCAPPLRSYKDKKELWNYVMDGTINCIASDHSPCTIEEKSEDKHNIWEIWGGISGIQTTFQVMFNKVVNEKGLSPTILTKLLSNEPAKTFNLYPRKGNLNIGSDADIVIVDPRRRWKITSESLFYKNKISAFIGLQGKGIPVTTIVRGNIVYDDGKIVGKHGTGCLVKAIR